MSRERIFRRGFELGRVRGGLFAEVQLQLAQGDDRFVGEHDRIDHLASGICLPKPSIISTESRLPATTKSNCFLQLLNGGHQDQVIIDHPDPHAGDRALERNRGDHQGGTGPGDGQHIGIVLAVDGQDVRLDLQLIFVALGEQRP